MKKLTCLLSLISCLCGGMAAAGYDDARMKSEIISGLDMRAAQATAAQPGALDAPGELGYEVYRTSELIDTGDGLLFVPDKPLYVRVGGGLNLGALSSNAKNGPTSVKMQNSWGAHAGLGWNASSYVRLELDASYADYKFADVSDGADMKSVGGTLYFDLARRWVRRGDITVRRTFVPFFGIGARGGYYKFAGDQGASGYYVAPTAMLGMNFMITDSIGLDLIYRSQIFFGEYGWGAERGRDNLTDITASIRFNF